MVTRRKRKSAGILDKASPVEDVQTHMCALFYGRSGTGKTTLAGTFPKPLLLLDVGEKGTDSLSDVKGIDVLHITDWAQYEEVYWELKGKSKYKTVVIDALHSLQGLALTEIKAQAGKKPLAQTSQKDFGNASNLMSQWVSNYRDLIGDPGMEVVFLAHDRINEVETEDDTEAIDPEVGPRVMPSVASAITGAVNVIGHSYIAEIVKKPKKAGEKKQKEVEYRLRIGPHGYYHTKIRKPKKIVLPEFITDPSYEKLLTIVKGKPTNSTKRRRRK